MMRHANTFAKCTHDSKAPHAPPNIAHLFPFARLVGGTSAGARPASRLSMRLRIAEHGSVTIIFARESKHQSIISS